MQTTVLYQLRDADGNLTASYAWGTWEPPDIPADATDDVHVVTDTDLGRIDLISHKFYGTPDLFWVILHVNDVLDQYSDDPLLGLPAGTILRIPKKGRVTAILQSGRKAVSSSLAE